MFALAFTVFYAVRMRCLSELFPFQMNSLANKRTHIYRLIAVILCAQKLSS